MAKLMHSDEVASQWGLALAAEGMQETLCILVVVIVTGAYAFVKTH